MKIAIFGCKNTTKFLIENVSSFKFDYLITISEDLGKKFEVADYAELSSFAKSKDIQVYQSNTYSLKNDDDISYISKLNIDVAFVSGWQRLIPESILKSIRLGVFGMHGSSEDLPKGRGRSPLNWSLIEGRKLFHTNLFKYDPGVDSGDIVGRFTFSINQFDTCETLHFKNSLAMIKLIEGNIKKIMEGSLELTQQSSTDPTYYPKRSPHDSLIDWNQDIFYIESFIRAVTKPFNGAYSYINQNCIKIYRASIFEDDTVDYNFLGSTPGTVLTVFPNDKFLLRCINGILIVHEYDYNTDIKRGDILKSSSKSVKYFSLNKFGNYDMPDNNT